MRLIGTKPGDKIKIIFYFCYEFSFTFNTNQMPMKESKLTGQKFWDDYWGEKSVQKTDTKPNLAIREILKTFNEHLPSIKGLTILEIGGGYGEYLLYLATHFDYKASSLDYSRLGNKQTIETFFKAGLQVEVFERDLFSDNSDLPKFDIVYSLGFIEHFDDPETAVAKHLDLVKPGGILMLGVPNYSGIYRHVLKRLAPSIEQTHNMHIMDLANWKEFEKILQIEPVFTGYVGGFEPLNMKKLEVKTTLNNIIYFFTRVLMVLFSFKMQFLRRFNSKYWSCYLIGIYRKKDS